MKLVYSIIHSLAEEEIMSNNKLNNQIEYKLDL